MMRCCMALIVPRRSSCPGIGPDSGRSSPGVHAVPRCSASMPSTSAATIGHDDRGGPRPPGAGQRVDHPGQRRSAPATRPARSTSRPRTSCRTRRGSAAPRPRTRSRSAPRRPPARRSRARSITVVGIERTRSQGVRSRNCAPSYHFRPRSRRRSPAALAASEPLRSTQTRSTSAERAEPGVRRDRPRRSTRAAADEQRRRGGAAPASGATGRDLGAPTSRRPSPGRARRPSAPR